MTEWLRATCWRSGGEPAISAAPCGSAPTRRGWPNRRSRRSTGYQDFRAPPPPLRGQYRLQGAAGGMRTGVRRHVAGRGVAGDGRVSRSSLVHRRAIPSGTEEPAARSASAVRQLHRGGDGAKPAGVADRVSGVGSRLEAPLQSFLHEGGCLAERNQRRRLPEFSHCVDCLLRCFG